MKLEPAVNVNAGWGGRVGLILGSNTYGGTGQDTTAAMSLLCCGVSEGHFAHVQIISCHSGHFSPDYAYTSNEDCDLLPDLMFGTNHVSIITNDCQLGHCSFGFYVEGPSAGGELSLPVNSNGEYDPVTTLFSYFIDMVFYL